jgi:hypothetical protein
MITAAEEEGLISPGKTLLVRLLVFAYSGPGAFHTAYLYNMRIVFCNAYLIVLNKSGRFIRLHFYRFGRTFCLFSQASHV